jgi:moderate conductance mechanosensitive channel
MSMLLRIPQHRGSKCWPGRLTSWVVWLGLMFNTIPSAIGAELQPGLHGQVIGVLDVVSDHLHRNLAAVALAPIEAQGLQADAISAWQSGQALRATTYSLVLLMIGGGVEWLYWCYAGKAWRAIAEEAGAGRVAPPPARAAALGLRRVALSAFGVALFAGGVLLPSSIFSWPFGVQAGVVGATVAILAIRVLRIVSTFFLSPHSLRLRFMARPDKSARWLNLAVLALGVALTGGYAAQSLLETTFEAPGLAAIASVASGIVAAVLSLAVLRFWLYGPGAKVSSGSVLRPIVLTIVILLCLALHVMGAREIVGTVLLWAAAVIAGALARSLVEAFTATTAGAPHRAAEYRSVLNSGVRIVAFGAATAATAIVWNIPLLQISQSDTLFGRLLARGFDVIVVMLIADLIWVWARTIIDGKLSAAPARSAQNGSIAPSARLVTLLPLLRKAIVLLLTGVVGLISLSTLGIDIAPLLAGAGVVGIAIGLGAQTLVRDIVSGVFYLLADSFRVGEYVEFGEIRGAVEGISLRFLRIRHHRGAVYTVPFGEIKWLVNRSRDWAVMNLEFRVPFETNLPLVKRIVEKVGQELKADPELGLHLIRPLESRGVLRMEERGMVVGVRCRTNPDDGQFTIRGEAYHRIRNAFDEHGIAFSRQNAKDEAPAEINEPEKPTARTRLAASSPDGYESTFEHDIALEFRSAHNDHSP